MARSGLVGMLVLGRPSRRRKRPFSKAEARLVSVIANLSPLALENLLYQKELIKTERMAALGTMAGMLAHDFRGPMTVIRGYAETLLEPGLSTEELRARADLIVQSVDRLERMTAETLDDQLKYMTARRGGELPIVRSYEGIAQFFIRNGRMKSVPDLRAMVDASYLVRATQP